MSERVWSRWQSVVETLAIVVVAVAIARMGFARPAAVTPGRAGAAPARRPEAPLPSEPVSVSGAQMIGSPTAKVGLVMYSDFECPFCGKFARETLPALQAQYVRSGKVLLVFRQLPLPMHQFAQKAAEAAECAGRQDKFWPFHDQLFGDQKALGLENLKQSAQRVGLEPRQFSACLDGQTAALVKTDSDSAVPLGVSSTPSFLAGLILADGRVKISERWTGAVAISQFQSVLDRLVGATGPAHR